MGSASLLEIPHLVAVYGRFLMLQPGSRSPESPYRANAITDEEYNTAAYRRTNLRANRERPAPRDPGLVFLGSFLYEGWIRRSQSLQNENEAASFCTQCAALAPRGGQADVSCLNFLATLLYIRSEGSHRFGDASVGPTWRSNRRTLF